MKSIGIDAHSRHCVFAIMNHRGKVLETKEISTSESEILSLVRSVKGPKQVAFEEGVISQYLYLLLEPEVERVVVCSPTGNRGNAKTDKIDAREIADLLRVGRLKEVFHTAHRFMDLRVLVSGYADLNQEIVRTKNRYKALFRQNAIVHNGSNLYNDKSFLAQLKTVEQRHVGRSLFALIQLLEKQKDKYKDKFERNITVFPEMKLLTTIPGIGIVRANELAAIIVTPYRFPTKYKFFAYAMLTRHTRTSDKKIYGIQKPNGQRQLKGIFKTSVWNAVRYDNPLRHKYQSLLTQGKEPAYAAKIIAKAIAAIVLGVWKSGEPYSENYKLLNDGRSASTELKQ